MGGCLVWEVLLPPYFSKLVLKMAEINKDSKREILESLLRGLIIAG